MEVKLNCPRGIKHGHLYDVSKDFLLCNGKLNSPINESSNADILVNNPGYYECENNTTIKTTP